MRRASWEALGTTATVVVERAAELPEATALLHAELAQIDVACSRFRDDSELVYVNANAGHRVRVGALLAEAVRVGLDAAAATGGLVTPTLGTAIAAVGYDRTFTLVRDRGSWSIRHVEPRPDAWREVELDLCERTLLVPKGVALDLAATAKALAADRAARAIAARTGGALVSLGGDVAVAGAAPVGGWPVRIADDHRAALDSAGPVVGISRGGLATSSTTVRRWRTTDGEAHHVIDPRTARPASARWRTVSVAGATCVDANVAALASLVVGEHAPSWLAARSLHARLVAPDGSVRYVGAWPVELAAA